MNTKNLTTLLLIVGFLFTIVFVYELSYNDQSSTIKAIDGIIDLSNINLNEIKEPIELDGYWNFFYDKLLNPSEVEHESGETLKVPGGWQKSNNVFGFATYSLDIKIAKSKVNELTFKIPTIQSDYVVWIDGVEIVRRGDFGDKLTNNELTSSNIATSGQRLSIITIIPESDTVSIVVWASNHSEEKAGIIGSFQVGSQQTIINENVEQWITTAIILGCLVAVGTYSLILYLFRRTERQYLFYSLISYSYFIRYSFSFVEVDNFLHANIDSSLKTSISNIAVAVFLYSSVMFFMEISGLKYKKARKVFLIMTISYFILQLFSAHVNKILFLYAKSIPITVLLSLIIIIGLNYRKIEDKVIKIYIIGFYGYVCFAIFEVMGFSSLFYPSLPASLYMIYCHAIVLAYNQNKAYTEVENMNVTLERLVEKRTHSLALEMKKTDQFIVDIAHDLRTPLAAITGYLQLVESLKEMDQTTRTFIQSALNRADQLKRLIEDLFLATKITNKILVLNLEILEVNEFLKEYHKNYFNTSAQKIHVSFDYIPEKIYVEADRNKLLQVMDNLIENAVKQARGEILVDCTYSEEFVVFCISDDGVGIEATEVEKLFVKGYTKSQSGTGLGLNIVKKLVNYMGGEVYMKSELGKGTKVYFEVKRSER